MHALVRSGDEQFALFALLGRLTQWISGVERALPAVTDLTEWPKTSRTKVAYNKLMRLCRSNAVSCGTFPIGEEPAGWTLGDRQINYSSTVKKKKLRLHAATLPSKALFGNCSSQPSSKWTYG